MQLNGQNICTWDQQVTHSRYALTKTPCFIRRRSQSAVGNRTSRHVDTKDLGSIQVKYGTIIDRMPQGHSRVLDWSAEHESPADVCGYRSAANECAWVRLADGASETEICAEGRGSLGPVEILSRVVMVVD